MFSVHNFKYECTKQCKSVQHAKSINAVLTKRSISDEKLAAFIAKTCRNFAKISDEGCTALHVAAAANRYVLVEWLLNNGANINAQLKETGETALHRALYYGNIEAAVVLLTFGAKIDVTSNVATDSLLYCEDASKWFPIMDFRNEIMTWGSNNNYNIGYTDGKIRPQHLRIFDKFKISIKTVSISTYHCLYLSELGQLYAVGHGKGGRLGTGNESIVVLPELVQISRKSEVIAISAAKDHSLILTKDRTVLSCGLNSHSQLGQRKIVDQQLTFKEVDLPHHYDKSLAHIDGILANEFYSTAFSSNSIFVWGLNCGQFGMKTTSNCISEPTKIPTFDYDVSSLDSSNSAIVFYSPNNRKLVVYSKFKTKKIPTPDHQLLKQFSINKDSDLTIIMCTEHGELYFWYEHLNQYVRCKMSLPFDLYIHGALWCGKNVLINTKDRLLLADINLRNVNSPSAEDYQTVDITKSLCTAKEVHMKLQRIPFVDRVVKMFYEDDGKSYVVLQEDSKRYLRIESLSMAGIQFKDLLIESSIMDTIHDIEFQIEFELIPAHKFILFSQSDILRDLISQNNGSKTVHMNEMPIDMFRLILKYIYYANEFSISDWNDLRNTYNSLRNSMEYDKSGRCEQLIKELGIHKRIRNGQATTVNEVKSFSELNRHSFTELYDVTIRCGNGVEIKAHKCILYARMEYFRMMFSSRWTETKQVNLNEIPVEYMEIIIDFLYQNNVSHLQEQTFSDTFIYNMITICDRYFIDNLKSIFESLLIDKMTIKKCSEMLTFAVTYNCTKLEKACLQYIIQNISRALEFNIFDGIHVDVVERVSAFYRQEYTKSILLSDPMAISDEQLEKYVHNFTVDLNCKFIIKEKKEKDVKSVQNKRLHHEKVAIKLFDEPSSPSSSAQNTNAAKANGTSVMLKQEINEISDYLNSKCNVWTKVPDRKHFKSIEILSSINSNSILDHKTSDKFKPLSRKKSETIIESQTQTIQYSPPSSTIQHQQQQQQQPLQNTESTPSHRTNRVDLAELLALSSKTYQSNSRRQRKRSERISESENAHFKQTPPKSLTIDNKTNKILNDSFVEIIKSPQSLNGGYAAAASTSPTKVSNSFTQQHSPATDCSFVDILAAEKRRRSHQDKIKTKPLHLTQIEETAISEFKDFYNIDNLYDECIRIDRCEYYG